MRNDGLNVIKPINMGNVPFDVPGRGCLKKTASFYRERLSPPDPDIS